MIAVLAFESPRLLADGRVTRECAFSPRSTLPLSAACLVANGVREHLSRALGTELDVDLVAPVVPGSRERRILTDDALVYRVRGRICDGFVVVRAADARALAAAAFGEPERPPTDALSEIERATVDRIARGLVPLCATLCGTLGPVVPESNERAACDVVTYFEVRTTGGPRFAIGFGLTRDPAEEIEERIELADLVDVEIEGRVEFARGVLGIPAFGRLAPGATIAFDTALGTPGRLHFGDVVFGRGACGTRNGRGAIVFGDATGGGA